MKKLIVLTLTFITFFCQAQERKNLTLSYGIGMGKILPNNHNGFRTYHGKSLDIFGISYSNEVKKGLFFDMGFEVIRYKFITTYSLSIGESSRASTLKMVSFPFKLRYEMGKYIFFNGGLMADLSKGSDLNGIGTSLGVGFQVKAAKGISVFVNPQANVHSLLNFSGTAYFAETNVAFGVAYHIR